MLSAWLRNIHRNAKYQVAFTETLSEAFAAECFLNTCHMNIQSDMQI